MKNISKVDVLDFVQIRILIVQCKIRLMKESTQTIFDMLGKQYPKNYDPISYLRILDYHEFP